MLCTIQRIYKSVRICDTGASLWGSGNGSRDMRGSRHCGARAIRPAIVAHRNRPRKHIERARIVLASADRQSAQWVAQSTGVSRPTVWRWQQRFADSGVEGLLRDKTRKPGKAPIAAETTPRAAAGSCTEPPHQATHWTGRAMAKTTGLSPSSVQRIWRAHKLQPHRLRTFKRSRDPSFAAKLVRHRRPLCRSPGACPGSLRSTKRARSEALDRTQPGLPIKPGRCQTMTHDYKRHGTTTLFAALKRARRDGDRALHAAPPSQRVLPLPQCRRARGPGRQANPHSARRLGHPYKHPKVLAWLARHPRWTSHFTPTSASWLNAVENSFPKLRANASGAASFAPSPTCRPPSTPISPSTIPMPNRSSARNPPTLSSPNSTASLYHLFDPVH